MAGGRGEEEEQGSWCGNKEHGQRSFLDMDSGHSWTRAALPCHLLHCVLFHAHGIVGANAAGTVWGQVLEIWPLVDSAKQA